MKLKLKIPHYSFVYSLTADEAVSVNHEVQGIAGHVWDRDAQELFGFVYVPQSDVIIRAGCKQFRCPTNTHNIKRFRKLQ